MTTLLDEARFLTDAMLGGLTRWLRVLDFDTLFNPAEDDRDLVRIANAENRVLLTRDRHLVEHLRPDRSLLITSTKPLAQLEQVVSECKLPVPEGLFNRCLVCNTALTAAPLEQAPPEAVAHAEFTPESVRHCPACQKYYWEGSHTRRMRQTLGEAIPHWLNEEGSGKS